MAESEEELKSLLMRMKEESKKVDLKLNFLYGPTFTSIHDYWRNLYPPSKISLLLNQSVVPCPVLTVAS